MYASRAALVASLSSLARGKWIEAFPGWTNERCKSGLPSQEGSGLKHCKLRDERGLKDGLPSQEGSGLKPLLNPQIPSHPPSSLARGKWIEAWPPSHQTVSRQRLPSQEGSGLKHTDSFAIQIGIESSLARGKWIEAPNQLSQSESPIRLPSQEGSGLKH